MNEVMETRRIVIYDTTLRDGMQGAEISYTLEDKVQIARQLDTLKVDYIEGGFPLSNRKEAEFFHRFRRKPLKHARLVAFGSTRKPGGKAEGDAQVLALLKAETPGVVVVGKAWTDHVTRVLQTTLEENLRMIEDTIRTLRREGREVIFDLEHFFDGYKEDPQYALQVLRAGSEAGAAVLVLCDTNGGTLPTEVSRILRALPAGGLAPLGVHFHNDTGTAVASSLAAIEEGAVHVQGTINGWGERCGNTNLCVFLPNLCLKLGPQAGGGSGQAAFTASACSELRHLTSLSRFVAEKANIIPDRRQPYVGEAAFCHKAGQHADVLSKAARLMEHIPGELVGNERRILLSELAGKSTIVQKLSRYGTFDKSSTEVSELIRKLKELEEIGYEYEAAEASFDLIIRRVLGLYTPLLSLRNYHLESFKSGDSPAKTVGRVLMETVDHKEVMGAAVGLGPVEALDGCLRDALLPFHPFIDRIKLTDYAVRVLNPEAATAARVRVFITSFDGERSWETVGVSENIVEASWQALVDSMEYYYLNFILEKNVCEEPARERPEPGMATCG
jgi:2-isopropylmalate synthase